jgi:hypothetical protein
MGIAASQSWSFDVRSMKYEEKRERKEEEKENDSKMLFLQIPKSNIFVFFRDTNYAIQRFQVGDQKLGLWFSFSPPPLSCFHFLTLSLCSGLQMRR